MSLAVQARKQTEFTDDNDFLTPFSKREERGSRKRERKRTAQGRGGARGTTTQEEEASLLPVSFHALSFCLH
jgi:hypothetical protein